MTLDVVTPRIIIDTERFEACCVFYRDMVGLAVWFLRPKKRDMRWALVGGGVAAIGASQFIFQTLAKPRNAAQSGDLDELRERLAEALDDDDNDEYND